MVFILGVLAAVAIPQFARATDDSREGSIRMNLRHVRLQLTIFVHDHEGRIPTLALFSDQMMLASDLLGNTAAIGTTLYPYGPYLDRMPVNANSGTDTITYGAIGSSAWYYDEVTGDFFANDSVATSNY